MTMTEDEEDTAPARGYRGGLGAIKRLWRDFQEHR